MTTNRLIAAIVLCLTFLAMTYDPREQPDGTVKEIAK